MMRNSRFKTRPLSLSKNLKRIQEVGYRKFVDEMQEKVKSGFLTSDVISSDMVITGAIEKMNI